MKSSQEIRWRARRDSNSYPQIRSLVSVGASTAAFYRSRGPSYAYDCSTVSTMTLAGVFQLHEFFVIVRLTCKAGVRELAVFHATSRATESRSYNRTRPQRDGGLYSDDD